MLPTLSADNHHPERASFFILSLSASHIIIFPTPSEPQHHHQPNADCSEAQIHLWVVLSTACCFMRAALHTSHLVPNTEPDDQAAPQTFSSTLRLSLGVCHLSSRTAVCPERCWSLHRKPSHTRSQAQTGYRSVQVMLCPVTACHCYEKVKSHQTQVINWCEPVYLDWSIPLHYIGCWLLYQWMPRPVIRFTWGDCRWICRRSQREELKQESGLFAALHLPKRA